MRIVIVMPFATLLSGCGKPEAGSAPSGPEQSPQPGKTDPKPKERTEHKDSEKPPGTKPPAEVRWRANILSNAPGFLMPYDGMDGKPADPEKVLDQVRTDLPTDRAANELLKKLFRVEKLAVVVVVGPAPEKTAPPGRPEGEDDGRLTVYLQPGKRTEKNGAAFLDFRYTVVAARSSPLSPLMREASEVEATLLTINDFLLRKRLGYYFVRGRADQAQQWTAKSAEEWRRRVDAEITKHEKQNAELPLKLPK